jgi:hypothetical protein
VQYIFSIRCEKDKMKNVFPERSGHFFHFPASTHHLTIERSVGFVASEGALKLLRHPSYAISAIQKTSPSEL